MPVHVRSGTAADVAWARARKVVLYPEEFGYDGPQFSAYVERSQPAFESTWAAEDGAGPVGFVGLHRDPHRPGWMRLRWVLVEPRARGAGVGAALLGHALAHARASGCAGVHLSTLSDLAAARRLYERAGFRLTTASAQPCPWAPWAHEEAWELPLRSGEDAPSPSQTA